MTFTDFAAINTDCRIVGVIDDRVVKVAVEGWISGTDHVTFLVLIAKCFNDRVIVRAHTGQAGNVRGDSEQPLYAKAPDARATAKRIFFIMCGWLTIKNDERV